MKRVAAFLIALFCAAAAASADERTEQIDRLLELSGLSRQLAEISTFASHQIQTYGSSLEPQAYRELESSIARAFDSSRLTAAAKQHYLDHYDERRLRAWTETLSSPLAKRMLALESQPGKDDDFDQAMAYARRHDDAPAMQHRRDLLKRLDGASKASELALDSQMAVLRSVLIASNSTLTDNKRLNAKTLEDAVTQTRDQMESALLTVADATYLYTYREISDNDLEQYVGYYESDTGRWAMNLAQSAIKAALAEATTFVERDAAW